MDISLDSYLMRLNIYKQQAVATCQDKRFNDKILIDWFTRIAPARAHEYGVKGMNRFGPRGVFAQIINCYMRWQRYKDIEFRIDWTDTMRDLWGYGVIMAIVVDRAPQEINWDEVWNSERTSEMIFELLVDDVWEGEIISPRRARQVAESSLALPFVMWNEFWSDWSKAQ